MRIELIPSEGNFYKANLHAHSTVSDGSLSPAQLKDLYKREGYSVLALTDHELLVDHSELNDADFLTITSYEYAIIQDNANYQFSPTVEFNLFSKNPHNMTQVCFEASSALAPHYKEAWRVPSVKYVGEPFHKEYTLKCMQKVIDEANANGFLVSLNHPHYSMITPDFFGQLNGLFAMEIFNYISRFAGINDYNPQMYDTILRQGKNIFCIAADDCHNHVGKEDPYCDKFGGFVMIKAPCLEYSAVISALEKGNFYASTGPEINSLYIEDGKVHLICSPAKYVNMSSSSRNGGCFHAPAGGAITEAVFDVHPEDSFMRFSVFDDKGGHADTHGYSTKY